MSQFNFKIKSTVLPNEDMTEIMANTINSAVFDANLLDSEVIGTKILNLRSEDKLISIQPPLTGTNNYSITLPSSQGTSGQTLINDGTGKLSWSSVLSGIDAINNTLLNGINNGAINLISSNNLSLDSTGNSIINIGNGSLNNTKTINLNSSNIVGGTINTNISTSSLGNNNLIIGNSNANNTTEINSSIINLRGGNSTSAPQLRLHNRDNTRFVGLRASNMHDNNYTITLPNTEASNGQVLTGSSNGELSWTTLPSTTTLGDININSVNGSLIKSGNNYTHFGASAPSSTAPYNVSFGPATLFRLQDGQFNEAFGQGALYNLTGASANTAMGHDSLFNSNGQNNTAIGARAGNSITNGINNSFLGYDASSLDGSVNNSTSIGYQSMVTKNNQIVLGNQDITELKTAASGSFAGLHINGNIFANSIRTPITISDFVGTWNYLTNEPRKATITIDSDLKVTLTGTTNNGNSVVNSTRQGVLNNQGQIFVDGASDLYYPDTFSWDGKNLTIYNPIDGTKTLMRSLVSSAFSPDSDLNLLKTNAAFITSSSGSFGEIFVSGNSRLGGNAQVVGGTLDVINPNTGGSINYATINVKGDYSQIQFQHNTGSGWSNFHDTDGRMKWYKDGFIPLYLSTGLVEIGAQAQLDFGVNLNNNGGETTCHGKFNALSDVNIVGRLTSNNFSMTGTNTSFGIDSAKSITTGEQNTSFGNASLKNITSGLANTAVGNNALSSITTGSSNVGIGHFTTPSLTTGGDNTSMGNGSLHANISGSGNTSIGRASLPSCLSNNNSAVGFQSLYSCGSGEFNSSLGYNSGFNLTTGNNNTFLGRSTDTSDGTVTNSTAIGNNAVVTKSNQMVLGDNSLTEIKTAANIISNGTNLNTAISQLINSNLNSNFYTTGSNTSFGISAGNKNITTGDQNTSIGNESLQNITSGAANTAVGNGASRDITSGSSNVAIGHVSSLLMTVGNDNTSVGNESLLNNISGSANTAIGRSSLINSLSTGNSSLGYQTLYSCGSGEFNSALGFNSGFNLTTGNNNTFLGRSSDTSDGTVTNSTAIGNNAVVTKSNQMVLGDNSLTEIKTAANIISGGTLEVINSNTGAIAQVNIKGGYPQVQFMNNSGAAWSNYLDHDGRVKWNQVGYTPLNISQQLIEIGRDDVGSDLIVYGKITCNKLLTSSTESDYIGHWYYDPSYNRTDKIVIDSNLNVILTGTTNNGNPVVNDSRQGVLESNGQLHASGYPDKYYDDYFTWNPETQTMTISSGPDGTRTLLRGTDPSNYQGIWAYQPSENRTDKIVIDKDLNVILTGTTNNGNLVVNSSRQGVLEQDNTLRAPGSPNLYYDDFFINNGDTLIISNGLPGNIPKTLVEVGKYVDEIYVNGDARIGSTLEVVNNMTGGSAQVNIKGTYSQIQFMNNIGTWSNYHDSSDGRMKWNQLGYTPLNISRELVEIGRTDVGSDLIVHGNISSNNFGITGSNTSFGNNSGNKLNTTGDQNTSIGNESLKNITSGAANTAVGNGSSRDITSGSSNVAIGHVSSLLLTNGNDNTSVGNESLLNNISGSANTAIGRSSLINSLNTGNSSLGYQSLYSCGTGEFNSALGFNSGFNLTTGNNNTFLGRSSDTSDGTVTNSTAIGNNAVVTKSNQMVLGDSSLAEIFTRANIVSVHDFVGTWYYSSSENRTDKIVIDSNLNVIWTGINNSLSPVTDSSRQAILQSDNTLNAPNLSGLYYNDFFKLDGDTLIITDNSPTNSPKRLIRSKPAVSKDFIGTWYASDNTKFVIQPDLSVIINDNTNHLQGVLQDNTLHAIEIPNVFYDYYFLWNGETLIVSSNAPGDVSRLLIKENIAHGIILTSTYTHIGDSPSQSTSNYNTSVGNSSFVSNISGTSNSAFGQGSLNKNIGGSYNSAFGHDSLLNSNGIDNVAFGMNSGVTLTSGSQNSFLGTNANTTDATVINSTAIGYSAVVTKGNQMVLGNTNLSEVMTSASGSFAGLLVKGNLTVDGTINSTTSISGVILGTKYTHIGKDVSSSTSDWNTSVGNSSFMNNTSGTSNSAFGQGSLHENIDGNYNSAFGHDSLYNNINGIRNSAFGRDSLFNSNANNNTAFGWEAGRNITTGGANTFLGTNANASLGTINNSCAIGNEATVTQSDQMVLGNSSLTEINTSANINCKGINSNGGVSHKVSIIDNGSNSFILSSNDYYIEIYRTSDITISLPDPTTVKAGQTYVIVRRGTGIANITTEGVNTSINNIYFGGIEINQNVPMTFWSNGIATWYTAQY